MTEETIDIIKRALWAAFLGDAITEAEYDAAYDEVAGGGAGGQ